MPDGVRPECAESDRFKREALLSSGGADTLLCTAGLRASGKALMSWAGLALVEHSEPGAPVHRDLEYLGDEEGDAVEDVRAGELRPSWPANVVVPFRLATPKVTLEESFLTR